MLNQPRILVRRERRKDPVKWKLHKAPSFIDPFPYIPGTLPEKMVFAELAKRNVPFVFQADWFTEVTSKVDPEQRFALLASQDVRPDFLLPQHKVVIEVQGEYWHAQPDQIQRDAIKRYIYTHTGLGYKVYELWDFDIIAGVADEIDKIDGINSGPRGGFRLGPNVGLGASSVAIANQKRARPKPPGLRRRVRRGRRRV